MKVFKCDRCGAYFEEAKNTKVFRIAEGNPYTSSIISIGNFTAITTYDLCEDCKKSFKAFMGKD